MFTSDCLPNCMFLGWFPYNSTHRCFSESFVLFLIYFGSLLNQSLFLGVSNKVDLLCFYPIKRSIHYCSFFNTLHSTKTIGFLLHTRLHSSLHPLRTSVSHLKLWSRKPTTLLSQTKLQSNEWTIETKL